MARRKRHEDHLNHEAWAIPYGDLITLLLAFFVVMYAISTVNEGKYRVLSDSLSLAFKGPARTLSPVRTEVAPAAEGRPELTIDIRPRLRLPDPVQRRKLLALEAENAAVLGDVSQALQGLVDEGKAQISLVEDGIEIAVGSDFLFASGSARVEAAADAILRQIAASLASLEHGIRVEGHTDNVPIRTAQFPSNWELSAARAAWIVRRMAESGVRPERLTMQGFGEYRPAVSNATPEGRRTNRRVAIVVDTRSSIEAAYSGQPPVARNLQEPRHERTDLSRGGSAGASREG